jgi:hypothetical protein
MIVPRWMTSEPVREPQNQSTLPDTVNDSGERRTADFRQYPARRMLSAFRGKYPRISRIRWGFPIEVGKAVRDHYQGF